MHAFDQTPQLLLDSGSPQFVVPLYQRTYAWQARQVNQLWADIAEQMEALVDELPGSGHFIGSIVLAPTPAVMGDVSRYLVVDGQQRLTTISLALAALRDLLRPVAQEDAERVHDQYLVNRHKKGDRRTKFVPTQDDRADYACVIDGRGSEAKGNIGDVYRLFRNLIQDVPKSSSVKTLVLIERAITERLELVAITAENTDNVHRIFQSLNNTGMSLSQGDLLRNYLFMLMPTRGDRVYQEVWHPMQRRLGAANLETLAYLDLVTQGYEKAARGDTYQIQTDRIAAFHEDEDEVIADVTRLAARAKYVSQFLQPDRVGDDQIRAALERLTAWGGESTWPVLLVALERLDEGTATREQVLAVISYLESYLVRRMIAGRTAAGVNRILIQAANQIVADDDIAVTLREFLSAPRRVWPTDTQLTEAIAGRNFFWTGKGSQRQFVLRRLEESYGHKEEVNWEKSAPTVEHVMPQTPTEAWLEGLHDPDDPSAAPYETHQAFVHRLGNLTLTAYNSEVSNGSFAEKKLTFNESKFAITSELAEHASWGPQEINERGARLAKRAIATWPAPLYIEAPEELDMWAVVRDILAKMPVGTWTTYGDIAAVTGRGPQPLGNYLANNVVDHAWRVLNSSGQIAENFKWAGPPQGDPIGVLKAEGIRFEEQTAAPEQRLGPAELAALLGVSLPDDDPNLEAHEDSQRAERFQLQLRAHQNADVVAGVDDLMTAWAALGGTFAYGGSAQTSAFFMYRKLSSEPWLWAVYPGEGGTVEVVFQHLKTRLPFSDPALRETIRRKLNQITGIRIDPVKINLRPSFRLQLLATPEVVAALRGVQEWFVETAQDFEQPESVGATDIADIGLPWEKGQ